MRGVVWCAWLAVGCANAEAGPPSVNEMHARYATLTAARDHVVKGNLAEARAAGAALAAIEPLRRPPRTWRPWLTQLDGHVQEIAAAPDLLQAALAVGRAGATCGGCHVDHRGGPSLQGADKIPTQAWQEGMNMPLHKWSVDWMWLGLLTQDTDAWRRGAGELDAQPITYRFADSPPTGHKPQLEQLVYVIAEQAMTAPPTKRGLLMGQLLATCSECHVRATEP